MNSVTSTGGTSTFNSSTKVLTLNGTKTQVNAHLANVYLDITNDWANNFVMSYNLTNPISNLQTAVSQNFNVGNTAPEYTWNLITNTAMGVQYPNFEYTTLVANPIGLQITDSVANANYTVQFARADSSVSNYDNSIWYVNGVASGTGRANLVYGPVSKATLNSANIALLVKEPTSTTVVGGKTVLNPPAFQYYFNLYRNDPIQGNVDISGNASTVMNVTVGRAAEISFTEVSSRNYQQAFKMFPAGNLVVGNTAGNALYRMTVTQTSPGNTGITTATVRGNIAGGGLAPIGAFNLPSGQANVLGYFQNPANVTLPGNAAFRDSTVASDL
jgi:hypothetical protein